MTAKSANGVRGHLLNLIDGTVVFGCMMQNTTLWTMICITVTCVLQSMIQTHIFMTMNLVLF